MTSPHVTDPPSPSSSQEFEDEVRRSLNRIRRAFAGLLDAVAAVITGGGVPKATDLQRTLDIPTTLAWRVHRVARAENPLREVESIPGSTAIKRVAQQAKKKGLPAERLTELTASIDAFETLVQQHAGNRKTFNSMVASLAGETQDAIDVNCRKAAFQANSQIWGVQARALMLTGIYHPGSHNQAMQSAILMGAADVKRLHTDMSPHVLHLRIHPSEKAQSPASGPSGGHPFGPALLEKFSTQPLPVVNREFTTDGWERVAILPPTMGANGATSFYIAHGEDETAWSLDNPEDEYTVSDAHCRTPAEVLIVDVLVYRDMFGAIEPQAAIFDGRQPRKTNRELLSRRKLPLRAKVEHLGAGPDAMHLSDLPRYPEMIAQVCDRLGWDVSQFDVYRCRIEYPIMSSLTAIWFPMPERGNWWKTGENRDGENRDSSAL